MKKVCMVFLLITHILLLQAISQESEAPIQREIQLNDQKSEKIVNKPISSSVELCSQQDTESIAEGAVPPDIRKLRKHPSTDKSVAGGGVIIGGLVTATFAAIFCYIRVTRKRDNDH